MQIVQGWRDIAGFFGVKHTSVRQWAQAGAPIYVLEDGGRPAAEAAELWAWRKEHSPHAGKGSDEREKAPPHHEEEKHEGPPALLTWGSVAQIKRAMREEEKERMRQRCR